MKAELTNGVPMCPICNKPTRRMAGVSMGSFVFHPAVYDESGNRVEQHPSMTEEYTCMACGKLYRVFGNRNGGYEYK